MNSIPLIKPYLGKKAKEYVNDALDSGWVSSAGKYVQRFQDEFAKYQEKRYAIATSSGTTALHLALIALGIREGDEVIVPTLTFCATINAVLYTGATPVLVDIDPKTWNLDPDCARKAITPKTRAILAVHLYGYPVDGEIYNLGVPVIDDCAESMGCGAFGQVGCFSFYGNKIITTGEGGMVVTDDYGIYNKIQLYRDHGMNRKNKYRYDVVGYNYRMTNLQAALGCSQLEEIDDILDRRRDIEYQYRENLRPENFRHFDSRRVNWLTTILIDNRDQVVERLSESGIETRPMFTPLHCMKIYPNSILPEAEKISKRGLSLPTFYDITEEEIKRVCGVINAA
jgi:perosamine synthetase